MLRRLITSVAFALFSGLLAGCGDPTQDPEARMRFASISNSSLPPSLAMIIGPATRKKNSVGGALLPMSLNTYAPTPDELFNWAEDTFNTLFSSYEDTRDYHPYKYRFYPRTSLYLAADASDVFIMGEATNWQLIKVGSKVDFGGLVLESRRKSKSGAVSSIPLTKTIWDKFWKATDPIDVLFRNGVGWYKAAFTFNSSTSLNQTPFSVWSTLRWDETFMWSRELSARQLLEAQNKGMKVVPWYFLSDTPQDAGKNSSPAAWRSFDLQQTAQALENATYELTVYLLGAGLRPEFYQLGAETDKGMLEFILGSKIPYPSTNFFFDTQYMYMNVWKPQATLLKAAIQGVKRADPTARIAIQSGSMGATPNNSFLLSYINSLIAEQVDFDLVGLTYPYHAGGYGAPQYLSTTTPYFKTAEYLAAIREISARGKKIYIGEFGYPNRDYALEGGGAFKGYPDIGYPFSDSGQAFWIREFIKHCNSEPSIEVCFYFYPEMFIGVSYGSTEVLETHGLFLTDGTPRPGLRELGRLR